jgi:hypothetical protein
MSVDHRYSLLQQYQTNVHITTQPYTLIGTDSGRAFTNTGALASTTITLPKAAPSLTYVFLGNAASPLVVQPKVTDTIRGSSVGVATSLTAGVVLTLLCITPGFWEIM